MTRNVIALDQATNDVFVDPSTGSLAVAYDAEAVGQHARMRTKTHYREWFLDTECGVPWLRDILGKGYDPALAESVVKTVLLETDGIVSIEAFSVSFSSTRGLIIRDVQVKTEYDGTVSI